MNATNRKRMGSVSLDQLLALNDEIAALVRAGIPLEKGLTELGREAPGQLGLLASRLADRMNAGESLKEILEKDNDDVPSCLAIGGVGRHPIGPFGGGIGEPVAHRPPRCRAAAFDGLGSDLSGNRGHSWPMYLFLFSMAYLVPVIAKAYEELTGSLDPVLSTVAELGKTVHIWGVAIPGVFVFAVAWWWYRTGRLMRTVDSGAETRKRRFLFGWHRPGRIPTIRQALIDGRMATFAEVLGLLDEHEVPLPEAIVLAADASGDRGLSGAVRTIAQQLEKGETFSRREDLPSAFPPLLGWSILSGMGRAGLQRTLATSSEMYRQRALRAERWAAVYMPIIFTVFIGGSAVLTQVLVVFLPFVSLLYRLGEP